MSPRPPLAPRAPRRSGALLAACLLSLACTGPAGAQNLERGREINATCAGCHGEFGQGGKKGEYPRLAGQRAAHIADQLKAFRNRTRINLPMFPYTQERELSDSDIEDVSAYLASIELPTDWPTFKPEDDALTRLTAMEKVMILPRSPGDIDAGQRTFQQDCAACHARNGLGRGRIPRLVGQYTSYLRRQLDLFIKGERAHDRDEEMPRGVTDRLTDSELNDVLAYLTTIQGSQAARAASAP